MAQPHINSWGPGPNGEAANGQQDVGISSSFGKLSMNSGMPPQPQPTMNHSMPPPSSTPSSMPSMVPPPVVNHSQSQHNLPGAPPSGVNHSQPSPAGLPPNLSGQQQQQQAGGMNMEHSQQQQNFFARPPGLSGSGMPPQPGMAPAPPSLNHQPGTQQHQAPGLPPQQSAQHGMAPPSLNQQSGPGIGMNHGLPPQPGQQQQPSEISSQPPPSMNGRQFEHTPKPSMNSGMPPQQQQQQQQPSINHSMPPPSSTPSSLPSMNPPPINHIPSQPQLPHAPIAVNHSQPSPAVLPPNLPEQQQQQPGGMNMEPSSHPQSFGARTPSVPTIVNRSQPSPAGLPPNLSGQQQQQQPGGMNMDPSNQQSFGARPPGPPGAGMQPQQPAGMPPMPAPHGVGEVGPPLSVPRRYPAYPQQQQQPAMNGPMPGAPQSYPPGPQQPQTQQQPQFQQQQHPGIPPQQPQQPMPGMPPMPTSGMAAGPTSAPRQRYPSYPQQQPSMTGPMPPGAPQAYPSYPQQPQQQQQQQQPQQQPQYPQHPGMPPQQQPQQDGGYYAGQGGAPPGGPQYPRAPGPGPVQPGGMAQPNFQQYGQPAQAQPQYGQGAPQYAQPSAQQGGQKRLDPDQMPSAIGVMQEDQGSRGGLFRTDQKGLLPPLVTTKFQIEDFGNASPRFVRSTMYSVPAQPDMLKQTAIPFALVINPFESPAKDEQPIPCVDLGPMGPVRCIRCKAYMSPLMQFIDGGRRFQCLLCKATTEVPPEYFQHLDHTGQRVDKWERPELWRGTYEYVATAEYCRNNTLPKEPAFIFVIDVSYNNVKSGLVHLLCSQMKNLIEALPSHTPVGFITYNSKVHFYNIDPSLGQPQMVIVPDVADMFMPLLRGFLVPCAEAVSAVDLLMEQIPVLFGDTKETEAVLGPAIVAGMEALRASDRVGKLLVFHSSLPVSETAPGKLKNREADRKLLGTEKEKTVLVPQSTYYNQLGQDCVGAGVSVDLYLFNNSYVDVATIGQVARLTGGSVSKYTYFQADIDGPRVIGDLILHLSRPIGFDGVMRVRTSTGVRPTDFFGHYYMANTTDVELAAIDSQKGLAVEIKHDASITDEDGVYIQIALLYTTILGQRRLRVHNLALNTCMQMADLYRNCELDTIINFMAKQSISRSVDTTPQDLKEGVVKRCAQMLATYRKHCANPSMPGQLILPECLKLLPLYINCVLRSDAVAGTSEITPDDRSWLMYTTMTMGVANTVHYFYPKLIPIAGPTGCVDEPHPVRCSRDKLSEDSAFILENGIYVFMWIGAAVSPDWLQSIFGVANLGQINVETITELPDHINSDESLRLRALIRSLRTERQRHMRLTIVRQRDKMELVMNRFLVEDRGTDGQPSYVDFLCHMHKEIRALLNQ